MNRTRSLGVSSAEHGNPERWNISSLILSVGFSLTGAGTVMLGVLLPELSRQWALRDDAAGLLLFLQFAGSALGAVLTRSDRVRSLRIGYALLAACAVALTFAGRDALFGIFLFYGLGLGMAMTSTSLLISDRYPETRAAKLEGINFAWSGGAAAGPVLFLPFLRMASLHLLFLILAGLYLLLLLWSLLGERGGATAPVGVEAARQRMRLAGMFSGLLPLVVMAACTVGVEASLSGWLTTYSHRASPGRQAEAVFAASCFWLGGMASRLAFSTRLLEWIGRHAALRALLVGNAVCIALLIASSHAPLIQVAAVLCGISIGPVYPLLLSFLMERSPQGWIFAVAGIGSALFPWLTGVLSASSGSLRYGLLMPFAAAVMLILGLFAIRPAPSAGPQQAAS